MNRRTLLKTAAAGVVGAVALSSPAVAFENAKPDHVEIYYDEELLRTYQPAVIDPPRQNADERPQLWYGWVTESPEYDYITLVYFLKYRTQRGFVDSNPLISDSHRYDREPAYVYVDPALDEVRAASVTAYHWLAAQDTSPVTLDSERGEHVQLRIIAPHNHYAYSDEEVGRYDIDLDVEPLGNPAGGAFGNGDSRTTFETWLDTGWRKALHPPAVLDPDVMRYRDSWWAEGRETAFRRNWRRTQLGLARLGIESPRIVGTAPESELV